MPANRREFLVTGASTAAALVIGFSLPGKVWAAQEVQTPKLPISPFEAWVHVGDDDRVKLIVAKSEMGQGIKTSLPMILAEELEVDWKQVEIQQAETRPDIYAHLGTGGSSSTRTTYADLRKAGATAREMLITAAATQWNVPREQCYAEDGAVINRRSNARLKYSQLVASASRLPLPAADQVPLKKRADFKIIGRPVVRVDAEPKSNGSAQFGLDARVPGMAYAVIARCPTFGGKVKSFDAAKAKATPGVQAVFSIEAVEKDVHSAGGIAVVADSTWAAMQGRRALAIEWDNGPHANESSEGLRSAFEAAARQSGKALRNDGDVEKAVAGVNLIESVYEVPFLAHATMEPMNITAAPGADRWEVWAPTQSPPWVQTSIAAEAGLKPEQVIVHTLLSGGGFGRRYMADFPTEVAQIAKVVGKPVQLVWTRDDDMQHDFYRPAAHHYMSGALDAQNRPLAWRHHLLSTSINAFWHEKDAAHASEMDGALTLPYNFPNLQVEYTPVASSVPVAWWRSVSEAMNAFATESFIDELAGAARTDPVQFRLQMLDPARMVKDPESKDDPGVSTARLKQVLQLAAEKSGWGSPLPKGHARGVACHSSFQSYVAEVVEVSLNDDGSPRVHRVVAAVDCGVVINPDGARSQVEGGIGFGLAAALYGAITIANGAVVQKNFDGFRVLRMNETPEIEVHLVESDEAPTGLGEPGVPPIAPAVANAVFALTGKRQRRLPFVGTS
jgi:isoquinoline 1-oxidoreductase subunit beta